MQDDEVAILGGLYVYARFVAARELFGADAKQVLYDAAADFYFSVCSSFSTIAANETACLFAGTQNFPYHRASQGEPRVLIERLLSA